MSGLLARWRAWRARRRHAARVERITEQLITASGYDVKTSYQEEFFRQQAREIAGRADRAAGG